MAIKKRDYSGLFVSFEGGEGAGKGTQTRLFNDYLVDRFGGSRVVWTREPGGTEIGEQVRNVLLNASFKQELNSKAELLLFYASRAQLVGEVISPALSRGSIVVADRFHDSSISYQGVGRRLGFDFIKNHLTPFVVGEYIPDITFVLDIDAEQGLRNVKGRSEEANRLDKEVLDFHTRVNQAFRDLSVEEPDRVKLIPYSHGAPEITHKTIVQYFESLVDRVGFK